MLQKCPDREKVECWIGKKKGCFSCLCTAEVTKFKSMLSMEETWKTLCLDCTFYNFHLSRLAAKKDTSPAAPWCSGKLVLQWDRKGPGRVGWEDVQSLIAQHLLHLACPPTPSTAPWSRVRGRGVCSLTHRLCPLPCWHQPRSNRREPICIPEEMAPPGGQPCSGQVRQAHCWSSHLNPSWLPPKALTPTGIPCSCQSQKQHSRTRLLANASLSLSDHHSFQGWFSRGKDGANQEAQGTRRSTVLGFLHWTRARCEVNSEDWGQSFSAWRTYFINCFVLQWVGVYVHFR